MTESESSEKIAGLVENESSEAHLRSKNRRRLRRVRDIQKSDRLLHIINYGGCARIADTSIGALTVGRCCTQESISNIPRIATARDGSSERPARGSAAAETILYCFP